MISKDASGFRSNTFLIRFPIILSVYRDYRMQKVMRRMVKWNAMIYPRGKEKNHNAATAYILISEE